MTTTDANGIIFLEETDPISPFHTLINTLQQGTSDVVGPVLEELQDTDWINFNIAAGFEDKSGTAKYRRKNGIVYWTGLIGPTSGPFSSGTTYTIGTIPSGFRPAQTTWFAGGTTVAQAVATVVVLSNGDLTFRISDTGAAYVGLGSIVYPVD